MIRLIYVSRARPGLSADELQTILEQSRRHNAELEITGALLAHGNRFLQVLEGPPDDVLACYHRIEGDERHSDCVTLGIEPIFARDFPGWSMGLLPATGPAQTLIRRFFAGLAKDAAEAALPAAALLLTSLAKQARPV